jgi:16S rRNA (cytidine1402-2'-O)-methyltransferase
VTTTGVNSAKLHVVGTPIGNLGDFSVRAQQTLGSVALIACEDTRRTGLLLSKHNIANPGMVVMNEHTERRAAERIVETLSGGQSVAIVTDAGMPVISDPGAIAVAAAVEAGFEVVVVPGPTAVSAALALAGFGSGRYVFEGFLPRKGRDRQTRLDELSTERRIIVVYEAPHRVERTLADLAIALDPGRRCIVARELTKMHEAVWRGVLGNAEKAASEPRGEYVLVIDEAAPLAEATDEELTVAVERAVASGSSKKDASAQVARSHNVGRNRVYELANRLQAQ